MRYFIFLCMIISSVFYQTLAVAKEQTGLLKIYLDADRTRHTESAESIEMGIKTAFSEINNRIHNYNVEFVTLDHRGNSTRSKVNMRKAFSDTQGLLVIAGLHSPPLIKNRAYINENKMLTLVPWAAGGPITRYPSKNNWVFRLSVDDTKAGKRIAEYAITEGKCKNPHLLLEQTPWGESNRKTMSEAIFNTLDKRPSLTWYNWGVSLESSRIKLRNIVEDGADCLLFVGNANDGEMFAKATLSMEKDKRLPFFSHWGLTGGNFTENITPKMREDFNLTFIQTCFSFISSTPSPLSKKAFAQAQKLFPSLKTEKHLKAPPGFIHAYDLGRILIQALSQITLTNDMKQNRVDLKIALENLQEPVQGLVKRYIKPFSEYSENKQDAHEALGIEDFCMAYYGSDDEIIVLPNN